jgi:hypothetical protein
MAKPRIFVSSTYYDLRHIRAVLKAFIEQFGYEPVLFENGDIVFHHNRTLEDNCYQEVDNCDVLILIIGGRYGSLSKEDEELLIKDPKKFYEGIRSVTRKEYEKARGREIPVFIFVEEGVLSEYRTFLQNRDSTAIKYAHVDDRRVYEMIHDIHGQRTNNFVRGFSTPDDILNWLREQWAGLFAESLKRKQADARIASLEAQINDLATVVVSLKAYSEAIVKSVDKDAPKTIAKVEKKFEENTQLNKFFQRALISYLMDKLAQGSGTSAAAASKQIVVDSFNKSETLVEFLQRLGLYEKDSWIIGDPTVNTDFEMLKNDFGSLQGS